MTENATIVRFGHPATVLCEYEHWTVLLRERQATPGTMVLASRGDATSLGSLSAAAGAELPTVAADLEAALSATLAPTRCNYIALMLVDPHVHFHVIPRYAEPVLVDGTPVADPAWPGPPDLRHVAALPEGGFEVLLQLLRSAWPS